MRKHRKLVEYGGQIPIMYFKEGGMFIWYSPVLDLSTCGLTFEEAEKNFQEALQIFFQECLKHGTLEEALASYGWQKSRSAHPTWQPPLLVGSDSMSVPVSARN